MTSGPCLEPAPCKLAAIDVGTNTIRLVVAEVMPDRSFRVIDDEKVVTRLGRGLSSTGKLQPEAMEESATAIAHLKTIAAGYQVKTLRAAATSAVREATNGDAFVELVRAHAGLPVEVISAEDEARMAFLSVSRVFDLQGTPAAVVDVGGGSTEIVLASGRVIDRIYPLRLGAVRLTERFDLADEIRPEQYSALRDELDKRLRKLIRRPPFAPQLVIGTGGTFTNLASMAMHRGCGPRETDLLPFAVRGFELRRAEVKHFLNLLRKLPLRERKRVPGLNPDRADIIVAGLTIVDRVLKHLHVNRLCVHDQGIRAGLLHATIDELWPESADLNGQPFDRLRAVRQFAAACHHEQHHAEHVASLAMQLFNDLAAALGGDATWSKPGSGELLLAAALLHDVGYLINYSKHHKHTYHLIQHSGLPGFTRRELEVVANIARYHRGAKPRSRHANLDGLEASDRELVRRLAAILRLAVGLDRSHAQQVRGIAVRAGEDGVVVDVDAAAKPEVELWGAARKRGLFEETFGMPLELRWVQRAAAAPLQTAGVESLVVEP
ncbi:MAG: Ppx/GppA phosphatase family protein [Planctomycetota bacterium]|jgi:exopolyphosphatase/guanosine-5'-triphosphate,3'-diphosphate pyrophosphatase